MVSTPDPVVVSHNRRYFGGKELTPESESDRASIVRGTRNKVEIAWLPLTLKENAVRIIIAWYTLFFCCGGLPIILYFDLKYATQLGLQAVLAIPMAIFGACLLAFSARRVWRLVHGGEKYRPLTTGQQLDYFQYNVSFGLFYTIPLVIVGVLIADLSPELAVRLVALPLPLILAQASIQLVIRSVLSSVHGGSVKPAVFRVIEDVVAVDGGCGVEYRAAWQERYSSSAEMRHLLARMDWIWGLPGLVLASTLIVVIWLVDVNLAFGLGWAAPWIWAAITTVVTVSMTKSTLKAEKGDPTVVDA